MYNNFHQEQLALGQEHKAAVHNQLYFTRQTIYE